MKSVEIEGSVNNFMISKQILNDGMKGEINSNIRLEGTKNFAGLEGTKKFRWIGGKRNSGKRKRELGESHCVNEIAEYGY